MDKEQLLARLRAGFVDELAEHVRTLNDALLAAERASDVATRREQLKIVSRAVHTIKGGARAVDAKNLAELAHEVEDVLARFSDGNEPLDAALSSALLAAVDVMARSGAALIAGEAAPQLLDDVRARMRALSHGAHAPREITTTASDTKTAASDAKIAATSDATTTTATAGDAKTAATAMRGIEVTARVTNERLDRLLARSGELLVAARQLELQDSAFSELSVALRDGTQNADGAGRKLQQLSTQLTAAHHDLAQSALQLEDEVRRARMLPFSEATRGLDRVARDVAHESGKEVEIVVAGGQAEFDRAVLDGLREPLLHLVRNAVDHGIESAADRAAAGKPPRGRISVSAELRGGTAEVVVADDGGGIDLARVRAEIVKRGGQAPLEPRALTRTLFEPGFSTAARVTEVSGRGFGLDIVRACVEAMRGTIDITHARGAGTRFTLRLPISLATLRAVLVRVGPQILALPTHQVRSFVRVAPAQLPVVEGRQSVLTDGAPVIVASLGDTFGLPSTPSDREQVPLVLCALGDETVAFAVDELLDEREVTVKTLGPRVGALRRVAGGSILDDGQVALIANVPELIAIALGQPSRALAVASKTIEQRKKRVLLADDSITTRSLERSILEAAGYEVLVAVDGADAWRALQQQGADVVVSDVEMPNMDGFTLTETIRRSQRFRQLPIVLVTGRDSPDDRARGLEAGASAYVVKSDFEQTALLATVAQLVRD